MTFRFSLIRVFYVFFIVLMGHNNALALQFYDFEVPLKQVKL